MRKFGPLEWLGVATVVGGIVLVSAFLVLWALYAWFTPHFDRSDVVGVYVANYPALTETLELKEDGTFRQEVVRETDATPFIREGTWSFNPEWQTLFIDDCAPARRSFGGPTFVSGDVVCGFPVERSGVFLGPMMIGGNTFPITGWWSAGDGLRRK